MPSGPEAAVGLLVHRVLEYWACGRGPGVPLELFDAEYARVHADLEQDVNRRHFADLASTQGAQAWTRLRAWVGERCRHLERRVPNGTVTAVQLTVPQGVPLGPERAVSSERLRLGGQADRIRQVGAQAYEVRDFKSGNVLDDSGGVKAAIQLQLRAYGLLVLELDPQASVRLVVDDGDEHDVTFDATARAQAREEIQNIVARVPPPGAVDARRLATSGASCHGCSIRHVCSAYRESAPIWWRSFPVDVERVPDDIWGTMVEVVPNHGAQKAWTYLLTDAAGRRVCALMR